MYLLDKSAVPHLWEHHADIRVLCEYIRVRSECHATDLLTDQPCGGQGQVRSLCCTWLETAGLHLAVTMLNMITMLHMAVWLQAWLLIIHEVWSDSVAFAYASVQVTRLPQDRGNPWPCLCTEGHVGDPLGAQRLVCNVGRLTRTFVRRITLASTTLCGLTCSWSGNAADTKQCAVR